MLTLAPLLFVMANAVYLPVQLLQVGGNKQAFLAGRPRLSQQVLNF